MFGYLTSSDKGKVDVKWASKESGDLEFSGTGIITRLQGNSPGVNENATWDIDIQGTGALHSSIKTVAGLPCARGLVGVIKLMLDL